MEPLSQPISRDEAEDIMRDDIVTLLSVDVMCPVARAIETALASLNGATTCLEESLRNWQNDE